MYETLLSHRRAYVTARFVLLAALCLAALAVAVSTAHPAPAPVAKHAPRAKPLEVWGDWTKTFGGCDYQCWFRDDATYGTLCGWHGTYGVTGRVLTVTEATKNSESYWTWSVALDENLKGTAIPQDRKPLDGEDWTPTKIPFAMKRR